MNANQFGKFNQATAKTLEYYFNSSGPQMVVRETLRFVDDNFRLQGWQGATFMPWKPIKRPGTILVKTGALRRSFNYVNRGNGDVYFYNNLIYAKVHNEGFSGSINIRAHTRSKYMKVKASNTGTRKVKASISKAGETQVGGHTRQMNIIQRQFSPIEGSQSPILEAAIIKWLEHDIKNILTL